MAKQPKPPSRPSNDRPNRRTQSLSPPRSSARSSSSSSAAKNPVPPKALRQSGTASLPRTSGVGKGKSASGRNRVDTIPVRREAGISDHRRAPRDYRVHKSGMSLSVRLTLWVASMLGGLVALFVVVVYLLAIAALDDEIQRNGANQARQLAQLGLVYAEHSHNPNFIESLLRDRQGRVQQHLQTFYAEIRGRLARAHPRTPDDYWASFSPPAHAGLAPLYAQFRLNRTQPAYDSMAAFRHDLVLALIDVYDLATVDRPDSHWRLPADANLAGIKFDFRPEEGRSLVDAFEIYLRARPNDQAFPSRERAADFARVKAYCQDVLGSEDSRAESFPQALRNSLRTFHHQDFLDRHIRPIKASEAIAGVVFRSHDARTPIEPLRVGTVGEVNPRSGRRVSGEHDVWMYISQAGDAGSVLQFTSTVRAPTDETYSASVAFVHDAVMGNRNQLVFSLLGIALLAIALGVGISYLLAANVTKPINTLVDDVVVIAHGDYRHRMRVRSRDEIGVLARTIDLMTEGLQEAQAIARKAGEMEHDLSIAEEVVIHLLPDSLPKIHGYDTYAFYNPSKDVGGDYYDFFQIDDRHVGMIVADVAGKGIPGALVMTMARTVLRYEAIRSTSPKETFVNANWHIARDIKRGMFVTAFYLVLNTQTGEMKVASAGHNPMILWRAATGRCEKINPNGIALGFDKGPIFERTIQESTLQLYSGDRVVTYTDGIVEAMSPDGEEFEEDRLVEIVERHPDSSSNELTNIIVQAVLDHQNSADQHDDITIVTFRLH